MNIYIGYQALLEKVNAYFRDKIHSIPQFVKQRYGAGVCSLEILPHEVSVCYMRSVGGELQIQFCESFSYDNLTSLKPALTKFVRTHQLDQVNGSWVLQPEHYQLISTEALPVSPAEFQTSIRWKIKESLAYPIEDAVIDYYEIPSLKSSDNSSKKIMVVVSRTSYLKPHLKIIKESGLRLTIIDIADLALHNLTALYEEDNKTSALIIIDLKRVQLLITYHQKLYFSRFIDISLTIETAEMNNDQQLSLDRVILEIQRSFDYFQSQWRLPLPSRIFLAGLMELTEKDAKLWSEKLSATVELFDINNIVSVKGNLPIREQGKYLSILGGVMRGYVEVHETTG